jgi:putative ABC transport system permease protein
MLSANGAGALTFIPNPARGIEQPSSGRGRRGGGYIRGDVLAVIGSNLVRRPARTLLTAVGIALGVATIVALLSVTAGLKRSAGDLIHLGGADFGIFQKGVADPTASLLPATLAQRMQGRPGVQATAALLLIVEAIPSQPAAIVFGMDPNGFVAARQVYATGGFPRAPGQIGLGDQLADQLHARIGARVRVNRRTFTVSGTYHSSTFFEDSGATLSLGAAQALARRPGEVTTVAVAVQPGVRTRTVRDRLLRAFPGLQVVSSPDEAARAGGNSQLIGKAVVVIVVLALIIGGIAVANTMAMAVIERQPEFALLATIGWSPTRVAGLVLGEGVGVSLLGAALGLLLGVVGAGLLVDALGASSYASPEVTAWGLGRGLLVGVAIGVLGGLYPAWRVSRLEPGAALARA